MKTKPRISDTRRRGRGIRAFAVLLLASALAGCADKDLFEAARTGNERRVRDLLTADPGALHVRDSVGRTALHHAAESGEAALIGLLLESGADPFALDRLGFTPLDYARFSGRTEAVDVLEKRLSIFEAVRRGEPDLVSKVLSENPDSLNHAGAGGRTPLHIALDQPSTAMLERLLQEGADPNTPLPTGESPLQRAAERGETAKVLLLVSAGADPDRLDQRGRGPLYSAIGLGNAEIIHILLQHGANPNLEFAEGLTPLQAAAQKGQTDTVQLLLSKGGRAEAQNENGRDALYWARKHRHYSLASILEETLRGDDD